MKYLLKNLREYLIKNISIIILVLISIILGVILSVVCLNILPDESRKELTNNIYELNNQMLDSEYKLNFINISINTFIQSGLFTLILLILGSSIIFNKLIYLLFVYNGYSLGICFCTDIMLMGNIKGSIYSLILFLVPYTIFIFFEIVLTILWKKFENDILIHKELFNIKKKLIINIVSTTIIYIIMLIMLSLSNWIAGLTLIKYVHII